MTDTPKEIKNQLAFGEEIVKGFQDGLQEAAENPQSEVQTIFDIAYSAFEDLVKALYNLTKAVCDTAYKALKPFFNFVNDVYMKVICTSSNKRIVHLALHAKKKRVRKKNYNRIWKQYRKAMK